MIEIGGTVVSREVMEEHFVCDLKSCKGICCVEGESGAPLEKEELPILDEIYEQVKPYLLEQGVKAIEEQGTSVVDEDGEHVTPLVGKGKECAYVFFEKDGTAKCGIEKAHQEGKVNFQKPISCHLYPVRITKYKKFDAVNYHSWQICDAACVLGEHLQVPVYQFVKDSLIRKYGEDWYKELEEVAEQTRR